MSKRIIDKGEYKMKKRLMGILLLFILAFACACSGGNDYVDADKYDKENYIGAADVPDYLADEIGVTREDMSSFTIVKDKAFMKGDISQDTIRQVKKLVKDYPDVKTIVMEYVGGSVDDVSNLEASRIIRNAGLNTLVASDGFIASGGTDFFCAGVIRTVEEGAQVGVHSWAGGNISNAALLPKDSEDHKKYIDYYKEMNMPDPEGFYFFTVNAADASDMYYMTMEELGQFGLTSK